MEINISNPAIHIQLHFISIGQYHKLAPTYGILCPWTLTSDKQKTPPTPCNGNLLSTNVWARNMSEGNILSQLQHMMAGLFLYISMAAPGLER